MQAVVWQALVEEIPPSRENKHIMVGCLVAGERPGQYP